MVYIFLKSFLLFYVYEPVDRGIYILDIENFFPLI